MIHKGIPCKCGLSIMEIYNCNNIYVYNPILRLQEMRRYSMQIRTFHYGNLHSKVITC